MMISGKKNDSMFLMNYACELGFMQLRKPSKVRETVKRGSAIIRAFQSGFYEQAKYSLANTPKTIIVFNQLTH